MGILQGAIVGGIIGLVVYLIMYTAKDQKYKKLLKTIKGPVDYSGLYHYASSKRYKSSLKFFDSIGVLFLVGKTVYYKSKENEEPLSFDLSVCSVLQEPDWRMLKWFSITTPAGEKYYFDSHKMGAFKNNSDETLKGLAAIKAKTAS